MVKTAAIESKTKATMQKKVKPVMKQVSKGNLHLWPHGENKQWVRLPWCTSWCLLSQWNWIVWNDFHLTHKQHFCLEIELTPSTENLKPKHKTVCWFRVHTSFGISPAFPYASIKNDVMWSTQAKKQEETNLYLCLLAFMSTHYSPLIPLLNFFTKPGLFSAKRHTLKVRN